MIRPLLLNHSLSLTSANNQRRPLRFGETPTPPNQKDIPELAREPGLSDYPKPPLTPANASGNELARQIADVEWKLRENPDAITFSDVQIMLMQEQGTTDLYQAAIPPEHGKPIPVDTQLAAMELNRQEGLAHAERMRKTVPVLEPTPMEPFDLTFSVEKIRLPNDAIRLKLSINDAPWRFQPEETDLIEVSNREDFLMAHDISRHLILNRTRSSNLTSPGGEYLTGQVTFMRQNVPASTAMYDGLIANIVDTRMSDANRPYSFEELSRLVRLMREDMVPVGSTLKLTYRMPPPDIVYESVPGKKPVTAYLLLRNPLPKAYFPFEEIPALKAKLDADSSWVKTEKPYNKGVIYSYSKPTRHPQLTACHEIDVPANGKGPMRALKYYREGDKKAISWLEGRQILKGIKPIPVGTGVHKGGRAYFSPDAKGNPRYFIFQDEEDKKAGTLLVTKPYPINETPVYTGHPYRPPEVGSIKFVPPDGVQVPSEVLRKFSETSDRYKASFEAFQQGVQDILEQGTLPLDVPFIRFGPNQFITPLQAYDMLMKQGTIKADTPITMENIMKALFIKHRYEILSNFQFKHGMFHDETMNYIAPFPPPPFKPDRLNT